MRKTDHIRIADTVTAYYSGKFGAIPEPVLDKLKQGSVEPDEIRGRRKAHHHSREREVAGLILWARDSFLSGKLALSAQYLGQAFHYIADGTCPSASSRLVGDQLQRSLHRETQKEMHSIWEADVSLVPTPKGTSRVNPYEMKTPKQIYTLPVGEMSSGPSSSLRDSINMCQAVLELTWRPIDRKEPEEEALIEETRAMMPSRFWRILTQLAAAAFFLPIILAWLLESGWWLFGLCLWFLLMFVFVDPIWRRRDECQSILKWYGLDK